MRTTVTIDDDVYEAALQQTPPARRKRVRFASFGVPKKSRLISAAKIQKSLDEDGIA
jgi:hypothetical protein